MATGNMPASMMKPIPRRMTANMTSVKVKPRRLYVNEVISFASDQGAVVAVDDEGDGVLVDPGFFGGFGAVAGKSSIELVVKAGTADLGVGVGEVLALEG